MNPEVWAVWALTALAVAAVVFVAGRSRGVRTAPLLFIAFLSAAATIAGLSLYAASARPAKASVAIQSPPYGARSEGERLRVEGVVQPAGSVVTLLVRSETDERWWVQDVVHADPQTGRWLIDAYLGTSKEGVGQSFTLIALASNDSALFRLYTGRRLVRGMSYGTVPFWNRSPLHLVVRVR